ncbi:MAG: hypothetical protein PHF20_01395 [Halothiobacillaceae bacterium]|nr:hypothetical protein [Halothiobacillaceae bacterium]
MSKNETGKKDLSPVEQFRATHAQRTAENAAKAAQKRSMPADSFKPEPKPWSAKEIHDFFTSSRQQAQSQTRQEEAIRQDGYFKRFDKIAALVKQQNLAELKGQPEHRSTPGEVLERLAAMRISLKHELVNSGMRPVRIFSTIQEFDKFYSKPENLKELDRQVDELRGVKQPANKEAGSLDLERDL